MIHAPFNPLPLLSQHALRHITPLKMYGLYGALMRVVPVPSLQSTDAVASVILVSPGAASQYDQTHYADVDWVVYPALPEDADAALVERCVDAVLTAVGDASFVVKTIDEPVVAALRGRLPERRAPQYRRALCTFGVADDAAFTARSARHERIDHDDIEPRELSAATIRVSDHLPAEALPLLRAHAVYSETELITLFAEGAARCHLRFEHPPVNPADASGASPAAVGVLLTFPNTPEIHEIGSLHVHHAARRAGHARALLASALDDLRRRQLTARYVVDATNAPSIALAQACGLQERLRLSHWVVPAN